MSISLDDTIAAIATAPGEAGIGIVRISGPDAPGLLARLFAPAGGGDFDSHRMRYGHLVGSDGEALDEGMAVWFQAPRSYTRQDVVELHTHGGSVALRQALSRALEAGARLAEPGEMTLRAFLNGRLDLAQAEAVLDLVRARSDGGMRAAMAQLSGSLSSEISAARAALVGVLAHLTATIDFPEDDVPPQDVTPDLERAIRMLDALLADAERGRLLREGLRVAIIGQPNVGKSSLLNRLLRHERAIVTPIAGTTRDTLEESLTLRGLPVVLTDTAGIRETSDLVESIGVERSRAALAQADLVLLVLDATQPLDEEVLALAAQVGERPLLVVRNKRDLLDDEVPPPSPPFDHATTLTVSALTGEGLDALEEAMWQRAVGGAAPTRDAALLTNPRHRQAIQQARAAVARALEAAQAGLPADFLTIELHSAVNALGEITGETATPDLLDAIFSRFCIGK